MTTEVNQLDKYTDEELVSLSLKDITYFSELFERYQVKLLRYICRISNFDEIHAQEILQDVFIKVWKNLNEFDTNMQFSSWVYRITHNECVSVWRKEKKHKENIHIGELDIDNINSKVQKEFIDEIHFNEASHHLQLAINSLPYKYKEVIILRYWENKEYSEISEILKKPRNTVGTMIKRAKATLKKIVEETEELQDLR